MDRNDLLKLEIEGFARETLEFIDESPSTYHVVKNASSILDENGFERLELGEKWDLKLGGRYYLKKTNTTIVAFTIPNEIDFSKGFKIFASHTDSPSIRIKPNPEIVSQNLIRLNTEVYGGPILSTWFDRPLNIAGRVILKTDDAFKPRTECVKLEEFTLTIPNLAIHQNRNVNNGYAIDKQQDLLPILDTMHENLEKDNYLIRLLAKHLGVRVSDILDFDLALCPRERGYLIGVEKDMMSSTRLDNLLSVYTGIIGLVESGNDSKKINVFVAFDNEEIGSSTKQGADSMYLSNVLERIVYYLGYDRAKYLEMLSCSFMLSADGGHLAHPSHMNKADITNRCEVNKGVAIKISVNQKYTSDGFSIAVIKEIVKDKNIKIQTFVNNSNEIGGSTIGPLSARHLDIDSVDLGVPMLAMHSVRELCGTYDVFYLKELAKEYFDK